MGLRTSTASALLSSARKLVAARKQVPRTTIVYVTIAVTALATQVVAFDASLLAALLTPSTDSHL